LASTEDCSNAASKLYKNDCLRPSIGDVEEEEEDEEEEERPEASTVPEYLTTSSGRLPLSIPSEKRWISTLHLR